MEGNKKESVFKKIENNILLQVVFFVVSMAVIVGGYVLIQQQIGKMYEIVKDDFSWVYQVDSIEENDGNLIVKGWGFKLEEDAIKNSCEILLYDAKKERVYYPKMTYEIREDVNQYFLCEYDYSESGFVAYISADQLDLENTVYEILIRPDKEREVYSAGYYANKELVFVHPDEFVPLEIAGTDLESIVEEGVLRVYQPDTGIYVYQHEGSLYWIADNNYEFTENDFFVEFQMNTTQTEKLPEERLENNWLWSNIGFRFSKHEIMGWNLGKYRVAEHTLPTEYSITKVWTGTYTSEWDWRADFRPRYEFEIINRE